MDVQAALADLLPLLYPRRGSGAAHGDMMKDGRDAVFERRGARLGDAVVGEADVEVAAGGREEEPVGAAPPKGWKGCQCPRLVEKSAAEPRADEDDANQAGDEPAVRAVSRWQVYYAHATFAWCCCVEECGVSEKRVRVVVVFFSPWFGWDRECRRDVELRRGAELLGASRGPGAQDGIPEPGSSSSAEGDAGHGSTANKRSRRFVRTMETRERREGGMGRDDWSVACFPRGSVRHSTTAHSTPRQTRLAPPCHLTRAERGVSLKQRRMRLG